MWTNIFLLLSVVAAAQALDWDRGAQNNNTASPFESACLAGNFRPSHGDHMPQATPSPFQITVQTSRNDGIYYPGEPVKVNIESVHQNDMFFAYHIRGDCSKAVFNGTLTCEGGQASNLCNVEKNANSKIDAITNTNNSMKSVVRCTWVPPSHSIGNVQFSATVVRTYAEFWTGVLSDVIKPTFTAMSYEDHQSILLNEKMAEIKRMSEKAMMVYRNMLQKQSMRGNNANPMANFMAAAAGKSNQQQQAVNPMMAMMQQLQKQRQGGNVQAANPLASFMQQNRGNAWGGRASRFNNFMNGGEGAGEAGENQGFGGW